MASSADLVWASAPLARIRAAEDHHVSGLQSLQVHHCFALPSSKRNTCNLSVGGCMRHILP